MTTKSQEEWHAERRRAEAVVIERARSKGHLFRCGMVIRVKKCRILVAEQRLHEEVEREQRSLMHALGMVTKTLS